MGVFFFSSRRRHTRYWRDWSSDVCSSDLHSSRALILVYSAHANRSPHVRREVERAASADLPVIPFRVRSEERRVGKSVDLGGRRIIKKKKLGCRSRSKEHRVR